MRGFIGIGIFGCDIIPIGTNQWRVGFMAVNPDRLPDRVIVKDCDREEDRYLLLLPDSLHQIERNYEVTYERITTL